MISYHGDKVLKGRFVAHVENHRRLDSIAKGTYGHLTNGKWRGCAVGCSLRSLDEIEGRPLRVENNSHSDLAGRLGIPLVLARLEDRIFEGLPAAESLLWPTLFARAIPVGRDLSLVWPKFAHWMLSDGTAGVIRFARTDRSKNAIQGVSGLLARQIAGESVSAGEWQEKRSGVADAAADAVADAVAAAAYAVAYAAAAYAADAADDAAAAAAAGSRARERHYTIMAEKLLLLMGEA